MKTLNPISTEDHSILAGLRSRLQTIRDCADKAEAYLNDQKKWRHIASLVSDIQQESETAEQQINDLL